MTVENLRIELTTKIEQVKAFFYDQEIDNLLTDPEPDEIENVSFNGFISFEAYRETAHLFAKEIIDLINKIYLIELDDDRRSRLLNHIITELSTGEFTEGWKYEGVKKDLTQHQHLRLLEFLKTQEEILESELAYLTKVYIHYNTSQITNIEKIIWRGNRKQLAELFIELYENKWILFPKDKVKLAAKAIVQCFDILDESKVEEINLESFYSTFRPIEKTPRNQPYTLKYSKVYTHEYIPNFNTMKNNSPDIEGVV